MVKKMQDKKISEKELEKMQQEYNDLCTYEIDDIDEVIDLDLLEDI